MVLKLKMSQVTDIEQEENQEPIASQVMNMGPELNLCIFVGCCSHLANIYYFWLFWYSVLKKQLDSGEWIVNSPYGQVSSNLYFYVTLLVKCHCHFVVSLVHDMLNPDKI
jgi:hypothetical protein